MQQKSVILFRYFIVFLVVICTSCVKDDLLENYEGLPKTTAGMVIKKIRFQDVRSNRQAFQSLQNFRKPNNLTQRGMYYEEFGVFIDTATIVSIEKDNKHSLTFRIINDEKTNTIENLVLQANDNDSYTAYITTYDVTEQEQQQLLNGETLLPKKPSAITKTTTNSRISIGGDGAGCAEIHSIQREECPDGKGGYIPFTGENNNNCAGMPVTVTYLVVTINLECMSDGGGSNPGTGPGTPYPGSNPGGTNPGGNGTSPGTQPGNPGTPPDPTEPIRDPGDGTPVITTPVLVVNRPTPCADLTNLMKSDPVNPQTEADIKPKLVELKSKTTLNYEVGYSLAKDQNGNYTYSECRPSTNSPKEVACKIGPDEYLDMHTHYFGLIEMFSFMDVYAFWLMYQKVRPDLKKEVTKIVVTKSCPTCPEVVYALKMEDFNKFAQKINDLIVTENPQEPTFNDKIEAANKKCKNVFQNSSDPVETFLSYFKDAGISLFQAENNLSNWSKLTLDTNNQVKSTPCH